ncbi:MAG TPA: ATP-dependent helicase C-terminal domain-containing protein [Acidimicrobiales bacterium]|nr:ATP-dependent helicase C-terminal domain-containing protein [Acidimicrobiales bacterium]
MTLPVADCLDAVRAALAERGVAVLQAPPGAGKTTAVPPALLGEPWLGDRRIVMLEPRRLATRAAARRMAAVRREGVGETIGYRTRDDSRVGPATRIEVVTEGILTRRLQRDPGLDGVGLVIFDEFHERSLQADLGLALALDARRHLRPDLRLLVMSATLDGDRVAALLGGAPAATRPAAETGATTPDPAARRTVGAAARGRGPAPIVTSESRAHPVEVRWAPRRPRERLEPAVAAAIRQVLRTEPEGDVLAFLPGAGEITRTAEQLAGALPAGAGVDVHLLYGALPAGEQDAALAPGLPGRRKVVLATDIAETSLTVEGTSIVVDGGLARRPAFDATTGLTRLETVPASRASADQRAGRAGRLGPGVAVRLWSKVEHAARRPFTEPEIRQADLAGLALELAVWGTDAADLAFLDPPPPRALDEARRLLVELGALAPADGRPVGRANRDTDGGNGASQAATVGDRDGGAPLRPTAPGREMASLPLHPRLARMVLVGRDRGQGWLACLLAALLEDRDVLRGRPDDLPTDVGVRLALLDDPARRHPQADGRALRRARDRARDLARRAGVTPGGVDHAEAGPLLAAAYPDRIAQARGGVGRYVLRAGTEGWLPTGDPLAPEPLLAVAEVDGRRSRGRIRLAAPLAADQLDALAGGQVVEHARLAWDADRDDLVARVERRLGRLRLGTVERRPDPGLPATTALVDRVRSTALAALPWDDAARSLQARVAFLRATLGEPWPDLSDAALRRSLDDWLAPRLAGATGRADLDRLDMVRLLRGLVPAEVAGDLDRLAPEAVTVPSGRRVRLDYGEGAPGDPPVLAVRVQQMFGTTATPTVAGGRVPVTLRLLSPADRPVQVTSDLAGFWAGSWRDVRKDMAGRYPKHPWPEDPAAAPPR